MSDTAMTAMQEVTKYPHGTFSWVELATTDPEGAKKFYSELLGWAYEDLPIGDGVYYTMFSLHGKNVAALYLLSPEQQQQGIQPHWGSYITVDNVDEATQKAQAAGGTVLAQPFDVMDNGRMSVIQDPTGATFSLWEARNHIGASFALTWHQLMTRDVAAATNFYTTFLGWAAEVETFEGKPYAAVMNGDRPVAEIVHIGDEMGDIAPNWTVYFGVEDCDASLTKIEKLGGSLFAGPTDFSGYRYAAVQDPQGAIFNIISSEGVDSTQQG